MRCFVVSPGIKCKQWAEQLKIENFSASAGWISDTLQRHGKVLTKLQGEAGDISKEDKAKAMEPFLNEFHATIEKHRITPDCVYNADQTGLYY